MAKSHYLVIFNNINYYYKRNNRVKTEQDLAYDRLCLEDIAKDTARFLSVEYDKVIEHLDRHDPAEAQWIMQVDEKMNFKELKNTNFARFTDEELTSFLKILGQYSRDFREVKLAIFKIRHEN